MSKAFKTLQLKTATVAEKASSTTGKKERNTPAPFLIGESRERLHAAESKAEDLQAQLDRLLESGQSVLEVSLEDLYEVPGRKRKLTTEEYEILKNNLANNSLITPIIVRVRDSGGYEVVSGHNRTQVFRELGKSTIPAIVSEIDEKDVNKDAFFANLIHSALPDYEKYLGFEQMLADRPELTLEAMSNSVGISESQLSRLMAFRHLPPDVQAILSETPDLIGANTARDLAKAVENGLSHLVLKAVSLVSKRDLDQSKAKDWILREAAGNKPTKPAQAKPVVIKRGKHTFCNVRRAQKVLRIEFQSVEEAEQLQEKIQVFLKGLAQADNS